MMAECTLPCMSKAFIFHVIVRIFDKELNSLQNLLLGMPRAQLSLEQYSINKQI